MLYKAFLRVKPEYLGRIGNGNCGAVFGKLGLENATLTPRYFKELLAGANSDAKRIKVSIEGDVLNVTYRKRLFRKMGSINLKPLLEYAYPVEMNSETLPSLLG